MFSTKLNFTVLAFVLTVAIPLTLFAQTGTEPTTSTKAEEENIKHGKISVDLGIERRIDSSPARLRNINLSAQSVFNEALFHAYIRHLALREPINEMKIDEQSMTVEIKGKGRLLGIIPTDIAYRVNTTFRSELDEVDVEVLSAWSWLATKKSPDKVAEKIRSEMESVSYLSVTQLRAFILESIVNTF